VIQQQGYPIEAKAMRFCFAMLCFCLLLAAERITSAQDTGKLSVPKISIESDKRDYKLHENIFLKVRVEGDAKIRFQFTEEGHFFYLILQGKGKSDGFLCMPVTEFRFADAFKLSSSDTEGLWLQELGDGLQLNLVIYGKKLTKLPVGTYQLRIAYATPSSKFWKLLREKTGRDIIADDPIGALLDGAFRGAIISEPVTITITTPPAATNPK
jgi:hypothetical protein